VYRVEAVNKWKVVYRCGANDVIADIVYGLLLLLVYVEVVLVFCVELIICSKLNLV